LILDGTLARVRLDKEGDLDLAPSPTFSTGDASGWKRPWNQGWAVEGLHYMAGYAHNHGLPIEWAEKGVRKEDHVLPWLRRMTRANRYGVYFIFKSMEQGSTF